VIKQCVMILKRKESGSGREGKKETSANQQSRVRPSQFLPSHKLALSAGFAVKCSNQLSVREVTEK
jgi:hypothetical protein